MLKTGNEAKWLKFKFAVVGFLWLAGMSTCTALQPTEILERPHSEVESALPASHPMAYYLYAGRLFKEGHKENALFWYFVGELRYRFYLAANPNLSPDDAPALFHSLHESVGSLVAAPSRITTAEATTELRRALDWDASHDNGVTSKSVYHKTWLQIRASLGGVEVVNKTSEP